MTQLKLIAREPTEEMLEDGFLKSEIRDGDSESFKRIFQAMFDSAPTLETEAEKRAKEFNVRVARYLLQLSPHIHGKLTARLLEEANKIIRALLAERRKHGT